MLAKNANDNACFLNKRGACEFFASKLAPTEGVYSQSSNNTLANTIFGPFIFLMMIRKP